MRLRGLAHVHSTVSYDGRHTLQEIVRFATTRRCRFVAMSEHSDTLTEERMDRFVAACWEASTPDCLLIPGIEFRCENDLHLLGFGVSRYSALRDPSAVADFIRREGGVAVLAHPVRYGYEIPSGLAACLDGLEVWNAGYNSPFVPDSDAWSLLRRLRAENHRVLAFGGQDLHTIDAKPTVQLDVRCVEATREGILAAVRAGQFTVINPFLRIKGSGEEGALKRGLWRGLRRLYVCARLLRAQSWRR